MRSLLFIVVSFCAGCGNANREDPVRIAIVANGLTHMPVALAGTLGYYQQEGVEVIVESLPSSAKTVEALLAGGAELACSGFDHCLQLLADGRAVRSIFVTTHRDFRAIVASPARREIRSIGDLRGRNLGVPGLGSSNHQWAVHVLALHGMKAEDLSFAGIGVGATALASMERGMVDAAVLASGDVIRLQMRNPGIVLLADATTLEGSRAIWKAEYLPGAILMGQVEWINRNHEKSRRVARAVKRTLAWLREHSPEDIRAAVPDPYRTSDVAVDVESLRVMKTVYSPDGIMPADGPEIVRKALSLTQEKIRNAKLDLAKTYTNEFVK